jgi:hypothetical protein
MEEMQDDSNILFKLELIKYHKTLNLNIHLNTQAENIYQDEQTITWTPTKDEQLFLLEALELIKQKEINNTLVFNKSQQVSSGQKQSISKNTNGSDQKQSSTRFECSGDDQWDSIDRIINNKLNIR